MNYFPISIALGRINEIEWGITPTEWLNTHWHVRCNNIVIAEPSSTFFVFLLAFVILFVSIKFLRQANHQKSRILFGLSMLAWSISTVSAGVSYQIFSYELKCATRVICLWTTPWEIAYLFFYVISVKLLVLAIGACCVSDRARWFINSYAFLMGALYSLMLIIGVSIPNQFLLSFEFMVVFLVPSYLLMFIINGLNYKKTKRLLDIRLIKAWLGMLALTMAYFGFYLSQISTWLWQHGIWFNANDVLHILLIIWALYVYFKIEKEVVDQ